MKRAHCARTCGLGEAARGRGSYVSFCLEWQVPSIFLAKESEGDGKHFDVLLTYSRVQKSLFHMRTLLVPKYSELYWTSVPEAGVFSVGIRGKRKV